LYIEYEPLAFSQMDKECLLSISATQLLIYTKNVQCTYEHLPLNVPRDKVLCPHKQQT